MTWEHDQDHIDRLRGHRIRNTLQGIPTILEDLEPTPRTSSNGPRSSERLLPISEKVLTAKTHLHQTLASWALLITEEARVPLDCQTDTESIATWLRQHTEWLAKHDAGQDAEDEIWTAVNDLETLTDRPGPTVFAGNCPTCDTPAYAPEGRQETHCKNMKDADTGETCGTTINVEEGRTALLERATTMTASAADISRILPVNASTVRQWGRRGKLGGYCDVVTRETRWMIGSVIDQLNRAPRERIAA